MAQINKPHFNYYKDLYFFVVAFGLMEVALVPPSSQEIFT
jgi:hypothetical protein